MSPTSSLIWAFLTPFVFIGSIYIKKPSSSLRDHPEEIKRRFLMVLSGTFLWNTLFYNLFAHDHLSSKGPELQTWAGLSLTSSSYISILSSLAVTFVLYAGFLVEQFFEEHYDFKFDIKAMRAYIIAPIAEECMYRSCLINDLVAGGFGWNSIWISALIFGFSHLFRIEDVLAAGRQITLMSLAPVMFQVGFTTVFGLYVGYIFLVTGSLYAVIIIHGFCNYMGIPSFRCFDPSHPAYRYRTSIKITYLAGIVSFFYLLPLMLNPEFFNSWHGEFIKRLE
jgi:prenyl protein peptidase